jgi:hypothetical protein
MLDASEVPASDGRPLSPVRIDTTSVRRFAALAVVTLFTITVIRTAWLSDDAIITMRTVLNAVHGYGLGYNITERVQAYTHPLWFLLLWAGRILSGNIYFAAFGLSIACSILAVIVLTRQVLKRDESAVWWGLACTAACAFSKSFVDFSTSGLENPLAHLLLVLLAYLCVSAKSIRGYNERFALVAGMLLIVRQDLLLLIAPVLFLTVWSWRGAKFSVWLRRLLLIGGPLGAWMAFSLVYYGYPFPNTAFAKLGTHLPFTDKLGQGILYVFESVATDPLTLTVVALAGFLAFTWGSECTACCFSEYRSMSCTSSLSVATSCRAGFSPARLSSPLPLRRPFPLCPIISLRRGLAYSESSPMRGVSGRCSLRGDTQRVWLRASWMSEACGLTSWDCSLNVDGCRFASRRGRRVSRPSR